MKNLFLLISCLFVISCANKDGDGKTISGYDYTLEKAGTPPNEGDFSYFALSIIGDNGTSLQEMNDEENLPAMQIPAADAPKTPPNPLMDILKLAGVGSTFTMKMPLDSIPNASSNPKLQGMAYIEYKGEVKKIQSETEYKASMEEKRLEMEADAEIVKARLPEIEALAQKTLKAYNSGSIKDLKTSTDGIKYVVHEEGTGKQAESGKAVAVQYYGLLLDGKMFDNSFRRGSAYRFTLGTGSVIQGWDLGIPLFKQGTKASIFIPYTFAYGEAGSPPNIPAKSDLMFYVEVEEAL